MFVNKINNGFNQAFKGYQYEKNSVGNTVWRFNYEFDREDGKKNGYVEFFKVKRNPKAYAGYEVVQGEPIKRIKLEKEGTPVDMEKDLGLAKDEAFAYRIMVDGEGRKTESGIHLNMGEYILVTRKGTTPMVQGSAVLAFPDSERPGARYAGFDSDVTGTIVYNESVQKEAENTVRTFSNKYGGNLAGMEYDIPFWKKVGHKLVFANPIVGGDNKSSHHYWNKNNFQISDDMGNTENYASFLRKLYQNGMKYVFDGTYTSEGLEGIHFQYALRWAGKNPQAQNWFRMEGIKDAPLGLGVLPKNRENARHRVINAPVMLDENTGKVVKNPNYNPNKETLFQIYDCSQISEAQAKELDKSIEEYKNIKGGNLLKINSHDDTLVNYIFEVNPLEYKKSLEDFSEYNKGLKTPVKVDSAEGTVQIAQFSNFRLNKKTEGGFVAWDANTDMVKMNYGISGYDEKNLQAIKNPTERAYARKMREIGAIEAQDMVLQAGRYWTKKANKVQTNYTAQVIKGAKTEESLRGLIEKGLLPEEALLTQEQINNVLAGWYNLEPKGVLTKDDVTVKAMMDLPLDALEFAENTVGILSTSYFSNRATTLDTLGKTRYELMKDNDPHLLKEYAPTYMKVNGLFNNELKDFAHSIIAKVNETATEKLLDENGEYTEFGEYVMENMGADIAKFALLKSLTGDKLRTKILPNGEITYDYTSMKENTTIKSLGLNGTTPKDEAEQLFGLMQKGLNKLGQSDIDYVAKSLSKRVEGENVYSYRLSEAAVAKAGLGQDYRLDAAKDVMDWDSVRNGATHFDEAWQGVIDFGSRFVQVVKKENPNAYIVAEITDIPDLMNVSLGRYSNPYDPNMVDIGNKFRNVQDAMVKFFNDTGVTSEAGYSYFFTDLIKVFSAEYEYGSQENDPQKRIDGLMGRLQELTWSRSADYTRNLFNVVGNHDKPRILHGMALDMGLFHGDLGIINNGKVDFGYNRNHREKVMMALNNANSVQELPLEVRLNIDNPEYFKTASTRAASMSTLLKGAMNETLSKFATSDEINYLEKALVDLTNGNYLGGGQTVQYQTITIPQLQNFESALREMFSLAEYSHGLSLAPDKKEALIKQIVASANNEELINKHLIHGDASWSGENAHVGEENRQRTETILRGANQNNPSGEWDYCKYNSYVVGLTAILRDAISQDDKIDSSVKNALYSSQKDFIVKYDNARVNANRVQLPKVESYADAMKKNGYAARDVETAIKMLIAQAEYRAKADGKLDAKGSFANSQKIFDEVSKSALDPALAKVEMIMAYLSALPGLPTIFSGDEFAQSGYDEKCKNVYLPRNAVAWSRLDQERYKDIYNRITDAIGQRGKDGMAALNNGLPYILDSSNPKCPAFLMADAKGNKTITVFNPTSIRPENRVNYHDANKGRYSDTMPANKYTPFAADEEVEYLALAGLTIPVGTMFFNSDARDNATYIVKELKNGARAVVRKDGKKILLNSKTAKNGKMILKHIPFRGNNINKQYSIVSNPYQHKEQAQEGKNLSLISKW